MDLRERLSDRSRWGELLDLIDQLPGASRTQEALANDPEIAAEIASLAEYAEPKKWAPRLSEMTLEAAITAAVFDRLGVLIDTVGAALGAKGHSQPFPRPTTEVDRIKERARIEAAEDLMAMFGHKRT